MKFSLKLITLIFGLSIVFGSLTIVVAQTSDSDKQALIQRFQQNSKADHKAAYDAAEEFLRKYPNDTSDTAQYMKKWVGAYEKVELDRQTSIGSDKTAQGGPTNGEPTLSESIEWLKGKFDENSIKYKFKDNDEIWTSSTKIKNFDKCYLTFETVLKAGTYSSTHWAKFPLWDFRGIRKVIYPESETSRYAYKEGIDIEIETFNKTFEQNGDGTVRAVYDGYVFQLYDEDLIDRLIKAFKHSSDLCQSQKGKEAF